MNVSKQSTKDTAPPANANGTMTSTQRILHLLWEAMPFLDAIGDSFRALADDPTDDIAARAVIPAHVKSLLEEAVIEIGELEQELLALHDPSALATNATESYSTHIVRDSGAVLYRVRRTMPEISFEEESKAASLGSVSPEDIVDLEEVLRGTGVVMER
ncbi:MAG: hypothetical protein JWQ98_429 [Chlorobi bacterium]|nr:hypothetical protein [Chlorobiota bacterium]